MPQVLVIFGSQSDDNVFNKLLNELKSNGIDCELKICSAHRNPKELEQIISETDAKIFIAGAGLSAALPGVIASQTKKIVIGIPVNSNYEGLDSLLSIHQMPSNVPVLGTGIEAINETVENVEKIFSGMEKIAIIKSCNEKEADKRIEKAEEILKKENVKYEIRNKRNEIKTDVNKTVFIEFIDLNKAKNLHSKNSLTIFVPICEKAKASDALKLLKLSKKGLWVGLNHGENAALLAVKILAI